MKKYLLLTILVIIVIFSLLIFFSNSHSILPNSAIFLINKKEKYSIFNITSFVTIIAIYFKFPLSKHKNSDYEKWTNTFMQSVTVPIIIYTDASSYEFLKNEAQQYHVIAKFVLFDDVWHLLNQVELWRNRSYTKNYKTKQWNLDPERSIHNPNLYAVWNCKHYVMQSVVNSNPFKSDFFIYTDIGAWRGQVLKRWPDLNFVQKLTKKLQDNILYGQINNINENEINPASDIIQATFIAGSNEAVMRTSTAFYQVHDELYDKGIFIGKDQSLMNYMAYVKKLKFIKKLRTWSINCTIGYDQWFFYQYFFADPNNYPCSDHKFSLIF